MRSKEFDYLIKQGLTEGQCCHVLHELGLFVTAGLYAQSSFDLAWQNRFKALDEKMQAIDSRIDSSKLISLAIGC
jgi:hypothetical protein